MRTKDEILKEIVELEKNVRDLEARIPPHSIPVELLQKPEDVQEELDRRKKELVLLEK